MKWTAYCMTCEKVLDECQNGDLIEVSAKVHMIENLEHNVLVGFVPKLELAKV